MIWRASNNPRKLQMQEKVENILSQNWMIRLYLKKQDLNEVSDLWLMSWYCTIICNFGTSIWCQTMIGYYCTILCNSWLMDRVRDPPDLKMTNLLKDDWVFHSSSTDSQVLLLCKPRQAVQCTVYTVHCTLYTQTVPTPRCWCCCFVSLAEDNLTWLTIRVGTEFLWSYNSAHFERFGEL